MLCVLEVARFEQVAPPIISGVMIEMPDFQRRPRPRDNRVSHVVSKIVVAVDIKAAIRSN